jgi:drug/metabolite transporter (DMT)-like permease
MALGLVGMLLLLQPRATGGLPLAPTLLLIAASASWAFGSIYQRRAGGTNIVLATAMQMIVGGALLGVEAAFAGQWQHLNVHAISLASLGGLAWLIVFGSLFAYSAYLWTMQNAPIALGSTYAYVNPIVSLLLGAVLFGERLTPLALVASAVIIGGVSLMMIPARRSVS